MSKELIEQLAKEHGSRGNRNSTGDFLYEFTGTNLEAFAKAYQAAAPIDNVAEALEKAAKICDKVNVTYREAINNANPRTAESIQHWREGICEGSIQCAKHIRSLIPDTQAAPIESERE
jgi:hypothetical protein